MAQLSSSSDTMINVETVTVVSSSAIITSTPSIISIPVSTVFATATSSTSSLDETSSLHSSGSISSPQTESDSHSTDAVEVSTLFRQITTLIPVTTFVPITTFTATRGLPHQRISDDPNRNTEGNTLDAPTPSSLSTTNGMFSTNSVISPIVSGAISTSSSSATEVATGQPLQNHQPNMSIIVGAVIGSFIGICFLVGVIVIYLRRKRQLRQYIGDYTTETVRKNNDVLEASIQGSDTEIPSNSQSTSISHNPAEHVSSSGVGYLSTSRQTEMQSTSISSIRRLLTPSGPRASQVIPYDLKYVPSQLVMPVNEDMIRRTPAETVWHTPILDSSISSLRFANGTDTSSMAQSTSETLTMRQMQIREEADGVREQIQTLQETVVSSSQGVELALARMMTQLQNLEHQFNSDWARGVTDIPPPVYALT